MARSPVRRRPAAALATLYVRGLAATALLAAACSVLAAHLVVNVTPSLPRGLYWVSPNTAVRRGDLVAFPVPGPVRALVHDRRYLPDGALLLKPVVASAGDPVCMGAGVLTVRGRPFGPVVSRDTAGRPLPVAHVCRELAPGEIFVAAPHAQSFDSRAFGPLRQGDLRGTATPLWTL